MSDDPIFGLLDELAEVQWWLAWFGRNPRAYRPEVHAMFLYRLEVVEAAIARETAEEGAA